MLSMLLLLLGSQAPGDTITLDIASALEQGLTASPTLVSARYRAEAGEGRADQASAWRNPLLAVSAENVGQQQAFTGLDGFAGLEGQAILRTQLPWGPDRDGTIRMAQAEKSLFSASLTSSEFTVRGELLAAFGGALRDRAFVESAREELETLSTIADALAAQAENGRASTGDAARANLARGMAATRLARREATDARGTAEISRLLGQDPATRVRLQAPMCSVLPETTTPSAPSGYMAPEVRMAEARAEAAGGAIDVARGARRPDIQPEFGVRRSGGQTGLYLGISTDLPFFDRGSRRLDAVTLDESVMTAQRDDTERRWASARVGAARALEALDRAGAGFDAAWFEDIEETVTASEARYRLGEGTLMELLDSRRARLQALDDYHSWQVEWWAARIDLSRLEGQMPSADLICMDPYRDAN